MAEDLVEHPTPPPPPKLMYNSFVAFLTINPCYAVEELGNANHSLLKYIQISVPYLHSSCFIFQLGLIPFATIFMDMDRDNGSLWSHSHFLSWILFSFIYIPSKKIMSYSIMCLSLRHEILPLECTCSVHSVANQERAVFN